MDNTNKISAMELQRNAGIVYDSVLLGVVLREERPTDVLEPKDAEANVNG